MYHYVDSGLDNIYLANGFEIHETPYGEGISIEDTEGLHKAIGKWLIKQPRPLTGAELRFLRLEMEQTQRDLASFLGTKEQTLRLWERDREKSLQGTADRLLRALYADFAGGNGSVRAMLKRLSELNEQKPEVATFEETDFGWKPKLVPDLCEVAM